MISLWTEKQSVPRLVCTLFMAGLVHLCCATLVCININGGVSVAPEVLTFVKVHSTHDEDRSSTAFRSGLILSSSLGHILMMKSGERCSQVSWTCKTWKDHQAFPGPHYFWGSTELTKVRYTSGIQPGSTACKPWRIREAFKNAWSRDVRGRNQRHIKGRQVNDCHTSQTCCVKSWRRERQQCVFSVSRVRIISVTAAH